MKNPRNGNNLKVKKMKLFKLLVSAVLPMMCLSVAAQTQKPSDNTPKKGNWTAGVTVGYNSFTNVTAQSGYLTEYEASAIGSLWSDKKLMVGLEGGYFVDDKWKLSLGGGLNFTHNPGYTDVPGTIESSSLSKEDMMGEIPNYRAVASQYSCNWSAQLGADRYFSFKGISNLMWFAGVRVGMAYALNEQYYDEWTSMGISVGETWSLRGALNIGIDYYVLPAMFVGASVQPFAYAYNMTSYRPQDGLGCLQADSHNFSILAAPTLHVGFKF